MTRVFGKGYAQRLGRGGRRLGKLKKSNISKLGILGASYAQFLIELNCRPETLASFERNFSCWHYIFRPY